MSDSETIDMLVDRVSVIKCHECQTEVDVSRALPFSVVQCPECGADLPVPALLGDFVLFKTIGKGAMGAVYQGFDQTLKRHVAIKVILQTLGEDTVFVDNFIKEAQALAALNHVNVVQIYSCGKEKGQPYIVMELITGERLDDLMSEGGPMNEQRVLEIAMDVANGLKAAHEIGLIHGDIKPQNILIDQRGTAKVVDFGLARNVETETDMAEIWGTPYYIAPEKARRQKEDHRADIYCLGATLFHALAGRPPFEAETAKEVVIKRLKEPAPNLQDIRPELNDETEKLISRMLEAEPFRRYPTYDSMQADLNDALQAARRGPRHVPDEKSKGGRGKWVATALLVAALAGGIGGLIMKKSAESTTPPSKGKTVMKLINGKLVPVFVPDEGIQESNPKSSTGKGASTRKSSRSDSGLTGFRAVSLTPRRGKGADAYIDSGQKTTNFGNEHILFVNEVPSPARKAYLRFDCSELNLFKCKQPSLHLTAAEDFALAAGRSVVLRLWGVSDAESGSWEEGSGGGNSGFTGPITWNNAPANAVDDPAGMLKGQAVLLKTVTLSKNVRAGDTIELAEESQKGLLLKFLQDDKDKVVTLVVTIKESQNTGTFAMGAREQEKIKLPELRIFTSDN